MSNNINPTESFDPKKIRTETTLRVIVVGLFSLVIVIAIIWGGLKLFPYLISILPDSIGVGTNAKQINWSILSGITSLITMSFVIGGVIFAFFEYVQNAIQRRREHAEASFNIYKEVYDCLMQPEALKARRWIILNLITIDEVGNDKKKWLEIINSELNKIPRGWKGERPPGKEYLKEVLNTFDFIGFVAKHRILCRRRSRSTK
jgi:ABC-type multidrug transport system fused ATPase/permease subunit